MSSRMPETGTGALARTRVWDLPTRLFHWLLAVAIVGLIVTAKVGGNAMEWHFRLGYVVCALIAFRLVWGFIGGYWSRFSTFFYAPGTVLRYLRGGSRPTDHHEVGHSPLGSLSVFGLLLVLAVQVGTGLFSDDEIASSGPLVRFVSSDISSRFTWWHAGIGQWLVISLVVLHVLAVAFYVIAKRKRLVRPMISGDKVLPAGAPASSDTWKTRLGALVLALLSLTLVWWISELRA